MNKGLPLKTKILHKLAPLRRTSYARHELPSSPQEEGENNNGNDRE